MTSPDTNLNPREVNELHRMSDKDASKESQHHTLGVDPYQASPGNHSHDGRDSKILSEFAVGAHSHEAKNVNSLALAGLTSTTVQAALEELSVEVDNKQAKIISQSVVGSRANPEAALANLLTVLASQGIITNNTVA